MWVMVTVPTAKSGGERGRLLKEEKVGPFKKSWEKKGGFLEGRRLWGGTIR